MCVAECEGACELVSQCECVCVCVCVCAGCVRVCIYILDIRYIYIYVRVCVSCLEVHTSRVAPCGSRVTTSC
jgi:hypothetical protein